MTMTNRCIAPFSAALLIGALAAGPAFAQATGPDPSAKAGVKTEKPNGARMNGSGMYSGVSIAHGPGVIDHDTADARAHMYGTTPTTGPAARSDNRTIAAGGAWTAGPAPATYGSAPGAEPARGYASAGGQTYGRCHERRVMVNQRHWEWRRFCE